ncbi:MAG: nicotinate-nucleotide--dimethylbenzimidazole phosphoribosyltransferase [Hyphomicrobium sp.]
MTKAADPKAPRAELERALRARIDGKAKPVGALGRLEELAIQIGLATGSLSPDLGLAKIIVFAGDHGLTAEGVTAYPSEVTREIAKLILAGTAGISVCARAANAGVVLVDAGLLAPLDAHPRLIDRRIAAGTRNARLGPAMTTDERDAALRAGEDIVVAAVRDGTRVFAFGEVGIGNTSASALLAHALTGLGLYFLVGNGAGVPPLGLAHKREILAQTFARAALPASPPGARAEAALSEFCGFEMVMMAGAINAAARHACIVVVDGFIATAVAAAAIARDPRVRDHCIFAHASADIGHWQLLENLGVEPLLLFGMRLGEGTGAALALPVVMAAAGILTGMADLPGEHPQ